ncbi:MULTISPECIES: hypothetical protein [Empedobacter]|uniref:Lipoprotein n=1 Tax=Empedobacter falsenii TaxID=343874 RepID=A0A7H9DQC4_9FLAO|nr:MULTISPECIES: hypothetical protein [Empedobacter]MDH2207547.1 hypothetical protein [Empedobacter sp. GD03644]QLL57314.1 hypothetical protein FH779_04095 [Empedobacter falsenii]
MKQNLKLIILLFLITSCTYKKGIKIKIINDSSFKIENVKFSAENSFIYVKKLEKGKNFNNVLDMNNISHGDGSYQLTYKINNLTKSINTGYFTNGKPLDKNMQIIIKNDTVFVDYKINSF